MGVTLEQGNAIRDFISNKNVCLEANYGSGKTTTIMHAYNQIIEVSCQALCLVYNSSMKTEMRTRVGDWRFIHTIHSAAQAFFIGVNGATDHGIHKAMHTDVNDIGNERLKQVTHIMIDEAQDLKPLFYRFIRRLMHIIEKMSGQSPVIMLVGDARQEVNRWNHADARFMTMSDRLGYNDRDWAKHQLTMTFRCPAEVVYANNLVCGLKLSHTPNRRRQDGSHLMRSNMQAGKLITRRTSKYASG
jgi:ATP-dependent exoDNAse (exonuclease V) beta subunit